MALPQPALLRRADLRAALAFVGDLAATDGDGDAFARCGIGRLRTLAAGKTDRDIAQILGISPRTVHKHLQRAYAALGVETRTAAVMRALPLGTIVGIDTAPRPSTPSP